MARVITVNDVLDGHVVLDIECLDRIYLNAYVPILQSSGQVVTFMTQHLGMPIPSPALMEKISTRFRRAVESFASANGIPWVRFGKDDRKIDVMTPYLDQQAATGRSGVAAVGVAQEFQRVWAAYQRDTQTAAPQYTFAKADRRVTCYYFYLWDEDFGAAFIKVCAYFPYPAKIWVFSELFKITKVGVARLSCVLLARGGDGAAGNVGEAGYAEVDGGAPSGEIVELAEFLPGGGEADLQAVGLAEPAFALGFADAGLEVVA